MPNKNNLNFNDNSKKECLKEEEKMNDENICNVVLENNNPQQDNFKTESIVHNEQDIKCDVVDDNLVIDSKKTLNLNQLKANTKKETSRKKSIKKYWHDYLWIASSIYLILGFFNILFAWLGLICFITPLIIAIVKGNKSYCNKYCGRGQLFELIGTKLKLSRNKKPPKFLSSKSFRYAFLIFFMTMFSLMIYSTIKVFMGATLKQAVTLIWFFDVPWNWQNVAFVPTWVARFSFGFYSVMLTSTILGFLTMVLFKPRSWCAYCPMGTMTQGICQLKNYKINKNFKNTSTLKYKK